MQLSGDSGRDRAYQYLRGTVLSDPAVSGTFINEQVVATEVGISRTPVREALLMLAAEDLVQLVPHRGAFVAPLPGREIAELMQARGVIECWAASTSLAADAAPVEAMNDVLEQQRAIVEQGDAKAFIELDSKFHALLVEAGGNSVLGRLYDNLRSKHVLLGVVALQRSATRRQDVLAEHQAIVDGLAAGEPAAAEKAILSHLGTTGSVLMQG
ncbi:GntR family transcriptional regulator [Kribbella sindirgiensis]|uniref:GntR family transcriptional regulator n=1 Tax=Kribbella sindirgiensis TaxID=1124744 RepID=A0A4R0IMN7_9ACTN|nr:GntR family transcriptional regulator [Kribbella sindirgiensis]TCC33574.1 GntR family transcriptional regulator [Kribbella sindirgiensis]